MARISTKRTNPRETIAELRDWCLRMEARRNPGSYRDIPGGSKEHKKGIVFYGQGRGWQLYKDWRERWERKFPGIELPPKPDLPPPPKPLPRKVLDKLVAEYKSYNPDVGYLEYWPEAVAGWRLEVWAADGSHHTRINIGANTHEAAATLRKLIEGWKAERNISGQEPSLGGQAESTGLEPSLGGRK